MAQYEKRILNALLDTYANSLLVLLNTECIDFVYQYLQRTPKSENVRENLHMLKQLEEQYHSPIVIALIQTVAAIEENEEECYVREFSIRHFGNSKAFEEMLGLVDDIFPMVRKG